MGDVSAANAANVALYDESGNRVGTAGNPLSVNGTLTVNQGNSGSNNWFVSAIQNGTWNVNAAVTGNVTVQNQLVLQQYNKINLTYTDGNVSKVEYLQGTSVVTTLFLTYTNGVLTSVERA